MTEDGLVSRTHDDKQPRQSGNDAPRWLVKASTSEPFTSYPYQDVPRQSPRTSFRKRRSYRKARCSIRVSPLTENDSLAAVFALPSRKTALAEETCVITATKLGMIKKSLVSELPGPSSQSFVLVRVNEGDRLIRSVDG